MKATIKDPNGRLLESIRREIPQVEQTPFVQAVDRHCCLRVFTSVVQRVDLECDQCVGVDPVNSAPPVANCQPETATDHPSCDDVSKRVQGRVCGLVSHVHTFCLNVQLSHDLPSVDGLGTSNGKEAEPGSCGVSPHEPGHPSNANPSDETHQAVTS